MAFFTFGVAPVDMSEPEFFGLEDYFPGEAVLESATPSEIVIRDTISGSRVIVTGVFAVGAVNDAIITSYTYRDSSGGLLAEWRGDGLRLGQLLNLDSQALLVLSMQGPDDVRGTVFTDRLLGFAGNDVIVGNAGHDFIDGGTGADRMVGGGGDNTYMVDNVGDVIVEDPSIVQPLELNLRMASVTKLGQQFGASATEAPSFSADGRYLAFSAPDTTLLPGDFNFAPDIYVKDLRWGEVARVASPPGAGGFSAGAGAPALSADGRYLAFENGVEVFVADLHTGAIRSAGEGPVGPSETLPVRGTQASITADGSTVVFTTQGYAPKAGPANGPTDVVLRDLDAGLTFEALTPGSILVILQADSSLSEYSPSGRMLQQYRVANAPSESAPALRDAVVDSTGRVLLYNGTFAPVLTSLSPTTGAQANHGAPGWDTANGINYGGLDIWGSFVFATDMLGDPGLLRFDTTSFTSTRFGSAQYTDVTVGLDGLVYVLDQTRIDVFDPGTLAPLRSITLSGPVPTLSGIAVGSDGTVYGSSEVGSTIVAVNGSGSLVKSLETGIPNLTSIDLRADGKIVAGSRFGVVIQTDIDLSSFTSFAGPNGSDLHVAWHGVPQLATEFVSHTGFESVSVPSLAGLGADGGASAGGRITPDGRYVVFHSQAENLVAGDTNRWSDVFVRDLQTEITTRVSVSAGGSQGDGASRDAEITPDGHYVVFESQARGLVPGVFGVEPQVYRKSLQTGAIDLVSSSPDGRAGGGGSTNAAISADGRFVVFESTTTDFEMNTTFGAANVFVRDMLTGKVIKLSGGMPLGQGHGGGRDPAISADGRSIAFVSDSPGLVRGDVNGLPDVFVVSNPFLDTKPANFDTIRTSVSYTLPEGIEQLVLTGAVSLNGTGNALDNVMTGNAGANVLDGGVGDDTMAGGVGDDTYLVDSMDDVVEESANQGNDRVLATASYTLSAHIERLVLQGLVNLNGTGNAQANVLVGNQGTNVLAGGGGDDQYEVGTGDTVVEAAGGGFDVVRSNVSFVMPEHVEQLVLTGTDAASLNGNSGDNALLGNGGNNALDGGRGGDSMAGGQGNDSYLVDNALDQITEAAAQGDDGVTTHVSYALATNIENLTLSQQAGNASGTGNGGNNVLEGNSRANVLDGGAGNDILRGLGGEDVLIGGAGDDRLSGGVGRDTLYGDAGADRFVFDAAINGVVNLDLIVDFVRGVDRIELASAIFGGLGPAGTLAAERFLGGAGATAQDALDRIVYDSATGMLYYDADGNGAHGMLAFAQVAPGLALIAGDFVVAA